VTWQASHSDCDQDSGGGQGSEALAYAHDTISFVTRCRQLDGAHLGMVCVGKMSGMYQRNDAA
jgi:hypothetical protein